MMQQISKATALCLTAGLVLTTAACGSSGSGNGQADYDKALTCYANAAMIGIQFSSGFGSTSAYPIDKKQKMEALSESLRARFRASSDEIGKELGKSAEDIANDRQKALEGLSPTADVNVNIDAMAACQNKAG